MQKIEFLRQYEKLCFAFDKEFKEGQMLVYFEYIADKNYEALAYAVNQSILGLKFFPKISEILDIMKEFRVAIPIERQLQENPEPIVPMPEELRMKLKNA